MKALYGLSLAAALTASCLVAAPVSKAAPLAAGYMQERGWEAPPVELDEVSRRGFHDGVEGAHKDFDNHRRPDVNNRDEFRHPHVPERDRAAYRHGFEQGYQAGVDHLFRGR